MEDSSPILSPVDACAALWPWFTGRSSEVAALLFLDESCGIVGRHFLEGGPDHADLPLRDMIGRALVLDAAGLLLAHNHPSGDPRPSAADILTTRRLCELAAMLDMRVIDHLVFAGESTFSYREQGLL